MPQQQSRRPTDYGATAQVCPDGQPDVVHTKNQLGVINGVYVPCLLNILGVILFLRLGWAVGQTGWMGALGMFAVGETLSIFTVLSLSAIVSNGNMKGGGSYYMISRCLGPEFGGAIGICFYLAYAVGTSFYVIGFGTEIVESFLEQTDDTANGTVVSYPMGQTQRFWTTAVASITLLFIVIVSLIGAGFFTKINRFLFIAQFGTIAVGVLSILFASAPRALDHGEFLGPSLQTLSDNMWPEFSDDEEKCRGMCGWNIVFGIIFPAMTGIMEGANLSGDLKDPAGAIGKGTLAAVATAIVTYLVLIFSMASSFPRDTLKTNMKAMQEVSPSEYIIILGIAVSSSSSALGCVFGGSRVLQALARDELPFPGLSYFSKGSIHGDEPRRAVIFTWVIAQACCLIGSLDMISPIISSFFCLSYASVNLACLMLDVSGTPNFRPRFKFYSRFSAGFGFLINVAVLFFLDVWYATISIGCLIVLFLWIAYKGPAKSWGDVTQAILFHQVRKYLLRLDERKDHVKFWRPSILLVVSDIDGPLIDFCNHLKKGGLYVLASALVGDPNELGSPAVVVRKAWTSFISKTGIKALPNVAVAPTARMAYQNLVLCSGLGSMRPNTLVVPFFQPRKKDSTTPAAYRNVATQIAGSSWSSSSGSFFADEVEFVATIQDTLHLATNVVIAANFTKLDDSLVELKENKPFPDVVVTANDADAQSGGLTQPLLSQPASRRTASQGSISSLLWNQPSHFIDVWVLGRWEWCDLDGSLSLQLQLAHIIHLNPAWNAKTRIRLVNVIAGSGDDVEDQRKLADAEARLKELCKVARIDGDTKVVITNHEALKARCERATATATASTAPPGSHAPTIGKQERSFSLLDINREQLERELASDTEASTERMLRSYQSENYSQSFDVEEFHGQMSQLNTLIQFTSASSKLVFLLLPPMPTKPEVPSDFHGFVQGLDVLLEDLPPTILLAAGERKNVIPQEL